MSWRISVAVACFIPAFALSAASGEARADEAFLCGPDTVVYVASADLEHKKQTDPCIARYFGLTVAAETKRDEPQVEKQAAKENPKQVLNKSAAADVAMHLKVLAPENTKSEPERQAALLPPTPSPGTDFRNVRVLNALSQDSMWFRHTR